MNFRRSQVSPGEKGSAAATQNGNSQERSGSQEGCPFCAMLNQWGPLYEPRTTSPAENGICIECATNSPSEQNDHGERGNC